MREIYTHAEFDPEKRRLIEKAGLSGLMVIGGLVVPSAAMPALAAEKKKKNEAKKEEQITPPEDLMREQLVVIFCALGGFALSYF